jgi:hypothetical protein
MSLTKRQLSCEVCGAMETATIRNGWAFGYVLCNGCADRFADMAN